MNYANFKRFIKFSLVVVLLSFLTSALIYAFSTGIDGRTLKTTTSGCSCHSTTPSTSTVVFISGPDSVLVNQTANYTVEISDPSKSGAGFDIAVRSGTLGVVTPGLHLSNGELVHSNNIAMTNHAVIITFSYTAPGFATADTVWATGLASNNNGQSNSDFWNWAPSKRINVKTAIGINPISKNVPSEYKLSQNYPNPFNPSTSIGFSLPKSSFAKLVVYDITGKVVENLINESLVAGDYIVNWNADNFSSGVYFYRLETDNFSETKRMTLIK